MKSVDIALSKIKLVVLLIGSLGFVVMGVIFILKSDSIATSQSVSPQFINVLGWISTVFFGVCAGSIATKLFDRSIGLRIDDRGITDNTSSSAAGLIEWQDIVGLERVTIASNKMIMVQVRNPEKYIARGKNSFVRRAMKMNNKLYGTPITIISSSLKISYKKLEELLLNAYESQ